MNFPTVRPSLVGAGQWGFSFELLVRFLLENIKGPMS